MRKQTKPYKVVICGGRDFNDYDRLERLCDRVVGDMPNVIIISGHANGADKLGELYASNRKYQVKTFLADWDRWGKSAGYRRNVDMVKETDVVIAFWDGKSKGTKHTIDLTKASNKPCQVFNY